MCTSRYAKAAGVWIEAQIVPGVFSRFDQNPSLTRNGLRLQLEEDDERIPARMLAQSSAEGCCSDSGEEESGL